MVLLPTAPLKLISSDVKTRDPTKTVEPLRLSKSFAVIEPFNVDVPVCAPDPITNCESARCAPTVLSMLIAPLPEFTVRLFVSAVADSIVPPRLIVLFNDELSSTVFAAIVTAVSLSPSVVVLFKVKLPAKRTLAGAVALISLSNVPKVKLSVDASPRIKAPVLAKMAPLLMLFDAPTIVTS